VQLSNGCQQLGSMEFDDGTANDLTQTEIQEAWAYGTDCHIRVHTWQDTRRIAHLDADRGLRGSTLIPASSHPPGSYGASPQRKCQIILMGQPHP
jgi:hypothetical protein